MTDYTNLMLAADWREEQLGHAIASASSKKLRDRLIVERNRLHRFARYLELKREFEQGAGA